MPRKRNLKVLVAVAMLCLCTAAVAQAHVSSLSSTDDPWTCHRFIVTRPPQKSVLFNSNLFAIQMVVSACYNGQEVQTEGTTCDVLQQDHFTIQISPCSTSGYYYQLNVNPPSDPHSGYYAQSSFTISNCFWKYACWSSTEVSLGLYLNMNGQFVANDGR